MWCFPVLKTDLRFQERPLKSIRGAQRNSSVGKGIGCSSLSARTCVKAESETKHLTLPSDLHRHTMAWAHPHTHTHLHVHTCTHTHTHTHTFTRRKQQVRLAPSHEPQDYHGLHEETENSRLSSPLFSRLRQLRQMYGF